MEGQGTQKGMSMSREGLGEGECCGKMFFSRVINSGRRQNNFRCRLTNAAIQSPYWASNQVSSIQPLLAKKEAHYHRSAPVEHLEILSPPKSTAKHQSYTSCIGDAAQLTFINRVLHMRVSPPLAGGYFIRGRAGATACRASTRWKTRERCTIVTIKAV